MKGEDARAIAVDWALSKEKWAEAQKELKASDGDAGDEGEEAMDVDEEQDPTFTDDNDDEQWTDSEASNSDADAGSGSASDQENGMSVDNEGGEHSVNEDRPPPPEEGATLFIRNVPFEATDDDLKTLCVIRQLTFHFTGF